MSVQGSSEWHNERLGHATASRIADIVAKTKTGWSASRENYKAQLVAERLTGIVQESYTNGAMQWGIEQESAARAAYCFHADVDVTEVGFIKHPTIGWSGASPDGLVDRDGLVEIKCPNTATHIETLTTGKVPSKYITQMQWQLAVTGRLWCDFVSFDPRMPESMRLFIRRVRRDDKVISELENAVADFLADVANTVARLRIEYENAPEPEAIAI